MLDAVPEIAACRCGRMSGPGESRRCREERGCHQNSFHLRVPSDVSWGKAPGAPRGKLLLTDYQSGTGLLRLNDELRTPAALT